MEKYDVYNQSGKKVGEIQRQDQEAGGGGGCGWFLGIVAFAVLLVAWTLLGKMGDSGLSMLVVAAGVIVIRGIYLCCNGCNTKDFGATFFDLCISGTMAPLVYTCIFSLLQLIGVVPGSVGVGEFILAMAGGAILFFLYSMIPAAIVAVILKVMKSN